MQTKDYIRIQVQVEDARHQVLIPVSPDLAGCETPEELANQLRPFFDEHLPSVILDGATWDPNDNYFER